MARQGLIRERAGEERYGSEEEALIPDQMDGERRDLERHSPKEVKF